MIAASEPLEFVPHGRTVLVQHPGQIYGKHNTTPEASLLYRLTNVNIKDDEMLLPEKDRENEWWCVREVFYGQKEEFEEEPALNKESKYDYNSESFRPSSRLKNDFNVSIKSELLNKKLENSGPSRGGSANSSSNMSKKFNLNPGSGAAKKKQLNSATDCSYEEELYVKGRTVIWSKGLISTPATKLSSAEQRETICCYTLDSAIRHATFADFHVDIKNTMLIDALNSQIGDVKKNIKIEDTTEHIKTEIMPSIVLLDSKCLRVYATDGREYITSIPFQVKKVWTMKYGVLLEKDATPTQCNTLPASFFRFNDSNASFTQKMNMSSKLRNDSMVYDHDVPLPTCFSLTHPLDEVTPILMKSPSHGLQYYNDGDLQIIFVSTNPSIILLYDWKLAIHSLWRVRKATREECLSMCPNLNTTTFSQTCDYIGSPMQSNRNATSWATGLGSPFQSKKDPKGLNTPNRSRLNSPMANMFHQQGMSPHASIGQASSVSMMATSAGITPPALPLYPDICIDHIWTDNLVIRRDTIETPKDIKTFLHTDLVGHDYLCFIAKQNAVSKLQILRLQKSHFRGGVKSNLIVGSVSTVMAKDAVVLPHLKMMALIDETGNIILQSGNNIVGKVHVGGVLARLIDSPYTKRSTFRSPFPRRSSLLPSRCHDATFDDSALHLLSPVPHTSASRLERNEGLESAGLSGLCDAAGTRLTLQFEAGVMYRISLPALTCSTLVARCCSALNAVLPKDITMQVLIKWYGLRNAPGSQDLGALQEWRMFAGLLRVLAGRPAAPSSPADEPDHTASKKQRTSSDGGADDWEYLLNSNFHKTIGSNLSSMLKLPPLISESKHTHVKPDDIDKQGTFNENSLLFPHILQVLYSLHLLYEDMKLNTLLSNDLKQLCTLLYEISSDLKLEKYMNHYWLDFPTEFSFDEESNTSVEVYSKLVEPAYFSKEPPSIFAYFNAMFKEVDVGYYPYLPDVNTISKDLIEVLCVAGYGQSAGVAAVWGRSQLAASTPRGRQDSAHHAPPRCTQAVAAMHDRGITPRVIDNMPAALGLACVGVASVWAARAFSGASPGAFACALRPDLALQHDAAETDPTESLALEVIAKETAYTVITEPPEEHMCKEDMHATGMEHLNTKLLALLYPMDHRMMEVFNILQSSQPVIINLTQRAEVSDHDFIEEQEKYLYALSSRTMALPVARGMVTLRTQASSPTEACVVPRVCVWGRCSAAGGSAGRAAIAPAGGDLSALALAWPSFHSGVAAGLALLPTSGSSLDSTWLLFNKPKGATELSPEHAGFLMALGLNNHLRDMPFMNIYEYLVKCNEMLSVGLLLGLAASYRGTMDVQATKLMSIHLEPLLPPTSIELDIQQNILVAALLGVGLLYQGSHHHHYAQALLHEIGRVRVWSAERCVEREGYALAAGLALGMLLAGAGNKAPSRLVHALRTYMLGGELTGSQKDKQKSNGVEGGTINLDVTSPGATLALGLVYMRCGPCAPADWLQPPRTPYELDVVRPDLLMLRVIARGLILWDEIEPSEEWIEAQAPDTIRPYCFVKPTEDNIDYEAMNQAYCNIIAGACFAMGIRFAGSGDEDARDAALSVALRLLRLSGRARAELAGRATLECCLCVCLLAASMIMAGRGDLAVLRVCRRLRARVPAAGAAHAGHAPLTHGGQMAIHMCVGLLFLMGGRGTLSTSRAAVGAMLAAFFPKFPTHTEDNRYHLQAFRHLYVLAAETRLLLPRDLSTGKLCYVHLQVVDLSGVSRQLKAPCMLPALDTLSSVQVDDPRYWPFAFHTHTNWHLLHKYLKESRCVDVKQRAGCLSYVDDPYGFLTILAQTLTLDKSNIWSTKPDYIELFTNDEHVRNFVRHYLHKEGGGEVCADCLVLTRRRARAKGDAFFTRECTCRRYSPEEQEYVQALSMVTYECLVKDNMCALPIWTGFLKIIKTMKTEPTANNIWQIKLLLSQLEQHSRAALVQMTVDGAEPADPPLPPEYTLAIKQKLSHILDNWELKLAPYLRKYLGLPSSRKLHLCDDQTKKHLSSFIVYHDLTKDLLKDGAIDCELSLLMSKECLSVEAFSKVETLVR